MKMQKIKIFKKHKSYITITVLILMMVLMTITYLFADAIYGELAIARNNKGAQAAFSLAEAGVQEAIYKVKYDSTISPQFLNNPAYNSGLITHPSPALMNNGSYSYTIQNTAKGVAIITSTGYYTMGLRTAQRKIQTNIAQANAQPPYPGDGAFYSHPGNDSNATGDLEFDSVTVNVYNGSLHSGRYISFTDSTINVEKGIKTEDISNLKNKDSTINCDCLIVDDGPLNPPPACNTNPGCTYTEVPNFGMPEVDFDSLKTQAQNSGKYYSSQSNFYASFPVGTSKTFDDVVYIEDGLTLDGNRTLNMNGVIATNGAMTIGTSNSTPGTLNLTTPAGKQSGVVSEGSFTLEKKGNLTGAGLIYSLFKAAIAGGSGSSTINFTGGFLARRWNFNGQRTINIHFDKDVVNSVLEKPVVTTPVIELKHWEEEY